MLPDPQNGGQAPEPPPRRSPTKRALALLGLLGLVLGGLYACLKGFPNVNAWKNEGASSCRLRYPSQVLNEDFQTPLDRDLTEKFQKAESLEFARFLDDHVLKKVVDDVQSTVLAVDSVEITPRQFPDRPELIEIIEECARVLKVKKPRVYVTSQPGVKVYSTNIKDPVIVIHSAVLSRYTSRSELRFLVGRELGHIRCHHVKWLMFLRSARRILPDNLSTVSLLPLLKWAREAELSADNAGLICCQDRKAAESSLLRQLLNVNEQAVGRINADAYLAQGTPAEDNAVSEVVFLWKQLSQDVPFVRDRITQLRKYETSRAYQHLWED